jgi:hypothetical protein
MKYPPHPTSLFVHCFHESKMSWFLDWGLDLQITIMTLFFSQNGNFLTVDRKRLRFVSVSLTLPGDSISFTFFVNQFTGSPV